jgi:hypothetical protein
MPASRRRSSPSRRASPKQILGAARKGAGSIRPLLFTILSLAPFLAEPAAAQQFGQWWWRSELGIGQRDRENRRQGETVSSFNQQELRFNFDLNGYLGHPVIGNFRLGLDLLLSEFEGGRVLDSENLGLSADLRLLPRGNYPLRLFFRRRLFDYEFPPETEDLTLFRSPDVGTTWGGSLRLGKGVLRGTLVGIERNTLDYLDPDANEDDRERVYLDWSRDGAQIRHHLRLEDRDQEYGLIDLAVADLTATFDQQGILGEMWNWHLNAVGIQRESEFSTERQQEVDDYRIRTRLFRPIRERDQLDINTNIGRLKLDEEPEIDRYGLSLFYRWRPRSAWEIGPFLQYAREDSDSASLSAPTTGLSLTWHRENGGWDSLFSARGGYGRIERSDESSSSDESFTTAAASGSVARGDVRRLRQELEAELGRNEFRITTDPILDLPDLGLARARGTENSSRFRYTLRRQRDSRSLSGWAEWNRRELSDRVVDADFESDTGSASLQATGRRYQVQVQGGETRVDRSEPGRQEIRFGTALASWRPLRGLEIRALYRKDRRDLRVTPALEGERIELQTTWRLGLLVLEGRVFELEEVLADSTKRTNRGFRWLLSRRFGGWLPIVSAPERRGVIR